MGDQSDVYKTLTTELRAEVLAGLTEREKREVVQLMAGNLGEQPAEQLMKREQPAEAKL
eukprot:SAG22_NODE_3379_length_1746_cov_1.474803_1_plen_59_part_00